MAHQTQTWSRRSDASRHGRLLMMVICLLPFGMLSFLLWSPPLFGPRSSSILDLVVPGVFVGWALIGVALAWRASNRLGQALALLLFSIPATFGLLLTPAVVLIVLNMP